MDYYIYSTYHPLCERCKSGLSDEIDICENLDCELWWKRLIYRVEKPYHYRRKLKRKKP